MHTDNAIEIAAPWETVYDLAADVGAWPDILSHYRYVRCLAGHAWSEFASGPVYEMSATRSGVPVRWVSIQEVQPERGKILYHHVAGATQGMDVEWRIEPTDEGCRATIAHDLDPEHWWLRPRLNSRICGRGFVMHIADNTLKGIAMTAESRRTHSEAVS